MSNAELIYFAWVGKSILIFLCAGLAVLTAIAIADMISERIKNKKEEKPERKDDKDDFFFGEVALDDEGRIVTEIRRDSENEKRSG